MLTLTAPARASHTGGKRRFPVCCRTPGRTGRAGQAPPKRAEAEPGLRLNRRLGLRLLALDSLFQLLHIGGGKHIPAGAAGLVRQFAVDGDDILHQQDGHHHQLIAEANGDGSHDDAQQAGTAHPSACAGPVIPLDIEQLEHAVENDEGGGEDVQRLQELFHHEELEGA